MTDLSQKLRQLREDRGWTQEYVAQRLGTSRSTMALWESPKYKRHSMLCLQGYAVLIGAEVEIIFKEKA